MVINNGVAPNLQQLLIIKDGVVNDAGISH